MGMVGTVDKISVSNFQLQGPRLDSDSVEI